MQLKVIRKVAFLLLLSCSAAWAQTQSATAWPEADKLFHADPRWLGADGAYSVDLGSGKVLWTFSDTWVAYQAGGDRRHAAFLHNTVAIQTGYDPSHASIRFYWRTKGGKPSEIFGSNKGAWMWPGSGIRIGSQLLLFSARVVSDHDKNSLGFKSVGWEAYLVSNPDDEPTRWKLNRVITSEDSVILASAVLRDGPYVYVFGDSEPEHDLYLARLSAALLAVGKVDQLEWWTGDAWSRRVTDRRPVQLNAGTETSVQRSPLTSGFIEVNSRGFGATDIVMQTAQHYEGPWGPPQMLYRPPESEMPDAFVYAAKSHSELQGADLVLTYATNGPDQKVAGDLSLYFPRFVKVDLHRSMRNP